MVIASYGYNIMIGKEVFKALNAFLSKNKYSSYFILCDENTIQHCLPALITSCKKLSLAEIIEIESGESSKSLKFSAYIWQTLLENKADKSSLLINLGGGVVSDLGGFTASVYKRGIDFINIPTSLLAMADASVGGKTGIDFNNVKNPLGTFAQPKAVFINPHFLITLSERHFQNGLAEIYKMALICDKKFWVGLRNGYNAETLIIRSVKLKNHLVLKDPYDKGIRNILNFGHTVGHAIEAALLGTKNELLHGEAIIVGIVVESYISFLKKMISKAELNEIVSVFQSEFALQKITSVSVNTIIELILNDKKATKNKIRFSLIDKIGSCKSAIQVAEKQIKAAIDFYNALFK